MKKLNNLYDNMISYSNVNYIYNRVKNNCHNKKKVFEFIKYKNCNIIDILEKLKSESYEFSNFSIFLIHEKKYRIIMSENIRDKIVNQMISYFILLPCFKCLIDSNIATRKNKGTSYGYKILSDYINKIGLDKNIYVLKLDINKYFYNIDHDILYKMVEKRIKDKKALRIVRNIINLTDESYVNESINILINREIRRVNSLKISDNEKSKKINELRSIPIYKKGKGLSIGCLSNQLFAIFYLNEVDHYIKEVLKHKYYIRYMDDLYVLDTDKKKLEKSYELIVKELKKIELNINNKSGIYRMNEGISFLGYTYYVKDNKLMIKYTNNTIRKIDRKLRKVYESDFNFYYKSLNSYMGYFDKCNTNLYINKYRNMIINNRFDKYKLLKNRYNEYIIFIKYKNRYYSYGNDLVYINTLLDKKYSSFSFTNFNKVIKKIDKYVVLEGNNSLLSNNT